MNTSFESTNLSRAVTSVLCQLDAVGTLYTLTPAIDLMMHCYTAFPMLCLCASSTRLLSSHASAPGIKPEPAMSPGTVVAIRLPLVFRTLPLSNYCSVVRPLFTPHVLAVQGKMAE